MGEYLESSDPERGAESPQPLKYGAFQKEGLVTFQVTFLLYWEKTIIALTLFLAAYQE